jgi:cyanate permease
MDLGENHSSKVSSRISGIVNGGGAVMAAFGQLIVGWISSSDWGGVIYFITGLSFITGIIFLLIGMSLKKKY